jgi:PhnB protein
VNQPRPRALVPHLFVRGAPAAVAFYRQAFGAEELVRQTLPDGRILFIEMAVGPARLLLSEEMPSLNALAPPSIGGSPLLLLLEVDDVDTLAQRAIDAGAEFEMPIREMFWGERYCVVRDPFGHLWALSTAREELTPEEVARRAALHGIENP